jgi:hypothetical protein
MFRRNGALEAREDACLVCERDPDAVVSHDDLRRVPSCADDDLDGCARTDLMAFATRCAATCSKFSRSHYRRPVRARLG